MCVHCGRRACDGIRAWVVALEWPEGGGGTTCQRVSLGREMLRETACSVDCAKDIIVRRMGTCVRKNFVPAC